MELSCFLCLYTENGFVPSVIIVALFVGKTPYSEVDNEKSKDENKKRFIKTTNKRETKQMQCFDPLSAIILEEEYVMVFSLKYN